MVDLLSVTIRILAESCDPSVKRVHVDCGPPPVPYGSLDPSLVCWYGSPLWGRPGLIAGPDGKAFYLAPALPDALFKDRLDGSYLGPKLEGLVPENQVTLTYHVREERKPKKEPMRSPCRTAPDSSEDALSDTSFSTLSAGTEDGLVSNMDDLEEEVCPTTEGELRQLDEILTEVDAPLRTKILSEVESLIAKYRKCLSVAVQGKKLYQMELEKFNYVQRGKIRKLRETNKYLEKKMRRLQQAIGEESGEPPPPPEAIVTEEEEEKPFENEPFCSTEGEMQDAEEICDSAIEGPTDA
ncbi:uncharacterized protein LOC129220828 [Uloborus diversus]|uniref:uncharacterized protein LOC129220828 n=1 Tax=Uloborus diversus TaxID=327109 RepID=UPI00240A0845|nr:uncharacterized protein LOC129220828 [Uloborus diversus]